MFKIIGVVLVVSSCILITTKKDFDRLYTIKFLEDLQYIINQIRIIHNLNYTYIKVFREIDLEKTSYFKDFSFLEKDEFLANITQNKTISIKAIKLAENFFNNIGKYDKESEYDFIHSILKLVNFHIDEIRKEYNQEKKINSVLGICIGLIISLVII